MDVMCMLGNVGQGVLYQNSSGMSILGLFQCVLLSECGVYVWYCNALYHSGFEVKKKYM